MICRKDIDLVHSSSDEDACYSCIATRQQGYNHTSKNLNSHKHSHRIKSSIREYNMKHTSHKMELYDDDCELNWTEEEFYKQVPSPTSNMDIWKKFELADYFPTPPSSPEHEPETKGLSLDCQLMFGERISSMFDLLDDRLPAVSKVPESCEKCGPLKNKLIQDCMWSATQPNLAEAGTKKASSPSSKCSRTDINSNSSGTCNRNRTDSCSGDVPNSSECVDPTSVFPYPLSEPPVKGGLVGAHNCMDTPSPSESEDEEEIDVVTVTITKRRSGQTSSSQSRSMSAQVAAMHNYSNSTSAPSSSHHSDHHYSAPYAQSAPQSPASTLQAASPTISVLKRSRPMSMPCSPQPPSKRHRSGMNETDLKRACQKLCSGRQGGRSGRSSGGSSRTSSDSEEGEGKRAQHNVLERKRRNDLKYSFCTLRSSVPEISQCERTPKVTILKKASDYITGMRKRYSSLENELARQKQRQEQLKAKLAQLRRSDLSYI